MDKPNRIDLFMDRNCRKCKMQLPLMRKKRCPLWKALSDKSPTAEKSLELFIDEQGMCKHLDLKED